MLHHQDREINGLHFRITQVSGWKGTELTAKLVRLLGPGLVALAAGSKKSVSGDELLSAAAELCGRLDAPTLRGLIHDLFETITFSNEKGQTVAVLAAYDLLFQGRQFTVMKLLWEAIKVNFQDFSDAGVGSGVGLRVILGSAASNVTGTSGPAGG